MPISNVLDEILIRRKSIDNGSIGFIELFFNFFSKLNRCIILLKNKTWFSELKQIIVQ